MPKNTNIGMLEPKKSGDSVSQYVKYGHIVRGDNHYQFYFDFEKFTADKFDGIVEWAAKKSEFIDKHAFNIVISPLQVTNSQFLKIIIDNTFGSNLHLLHININDTGKESIRTKFNYICEELKNIKDCYSDVNFYYVDDSICTGNAVTRAYKFLLTLCSQAKLDLSEWFGGSGQFKFEKVFLLVNRCSYETALTWVNDPVNDWYGYVNLCVPSYNTHSNTCPGCKVMERYELLKKRSATNGLTDYFENQAKKHVARKPREYDVWKDNEIYERPSYFDRIKLWAFYNGCKPCTKAALKEYRNEVLSDDLWRGKTLSDFLKYVRDGNNASYAEIEKDVLYIIKVAIADEDYMRLKTMDKAYRELVYGKKEEDGAEQKIQGLLFGSFSKSRKKKDVYNSVQQFISYIKVISRDYLSKNYVIKKAVLKTLIKLYDILIAKDEELQADWNNYSKGWQTVIEIIKNVNQNSSPYNTCAYTRYRILKLVVHRLAIMRSDYIIRSENILKLISACAEMKASYDTETQDVKIFAVLPSEDEMSTDFIASVKTATMEETDDGMCFKLFKAISELKNGGEKPQAVNKILENLNIENNRMLFDFMAELSDRNVGFCNELSVNWKYKGYVGEGGLKQRYEKINNLFNSITTHITDCGSGKYYQNSLSSYVRFYDMVFRLNRDENFFKAECKKIAEMVNCFNILSYLTEPEFKEKRHDDFDRLPYIFEDFSLSLKEMTEAVSSYILYKKRGEASQLVSRSGYVIKTDQEAFTFNERNDEFSTVNIGSSEFDLLIKNFDKGEKIDLDDRKKSKISINEETELVSGVKIIKSVQATKKEKDSFSHKFMVFDIPVKPKIGLADDGASNIKEDERHFFVVLEIDENLKSDEYFKIALRVLFLRNRLWESLKKYYSSLLNFRFYVNYMRSVNADANAGGLPCGEMKILHFSDLHLKDDESWNRGKLKLDTLCDSLNEIKGQIDLLAVTGDIIDHSEDAYDAQRKYKRVANLLFETAKTLWGYAPGSSVEANVILPHDWKRRIIITTGNHDYAAMNDVRIQTKLRRIEAGLPASSSGGTMSRYTYYLEFLSYFLDAPTQRLLRNDLNETRDYKNFKLIVGVVNTCSEANALQTNKVSINGEKLELVFKDSKWGDKSLNHLLLMHHRPDCKINYFNDKYQIYDSECYNGLYSQFLTAIKEYCPTNVAGSKCEKFRDSFSQYGDNDDLKYKHADLYKDMEIFYGILCGETDSPNDFVFKFISENKNLLDTQQSDDKCFIETCKTQIFVADNITVLAGHEHKNENNPFQMNGHEASIFVVNKLYEPKDEKETPNDPQGNVWFEVITLPVNRAQKKDIKEVKVIKH